MPQYTFNVQDYPSYGGLPPGFGSSVIQTIQLAFDASSVGPSNPTNAIVARLPLAVTGTITSVAVIGNPVTLGSYFNIVWGESAESGSVPLVGTAAVYGQQLFVTDQLLPPAGNVQIYLPVLASWPAGADLTLRLLSPSTGGIGNLKVAIAMQGAA